MSAKRIVMSFLNSAEGYFHTRRIIEDQVKQPRDLYGPVSDRPERWDYSDIRDISKSDLDNILTFAMLALDKELYRLIPSTALNAALQYSIHTFDNCRFQSKIDAPVYKVLMQLLKQKIMSRGI